MKSLTVGELENLCESMSALVGSQLQEIIPNDRGLALGLYRDRITYLILDLSNNNPGIFLFDQIPFWKKSLKPKPVSLFLNSHAKNLVLRQITLQKDQGRVVKILFSNSTKSCELECIFIPKQANLLVQASDSEARRVEVKKISWVKPRVLSAIPQIFDQTPNRDWMQIHQEWLQTFNSAKSLVGSSLDPVAQWEKTREAQILKKKKALAAVVKDLNDDSDIKWQELGELLKVQSASELKEDWAGWIDVKLSHKDNRERAFHKAKQVRQKKEGHRLRMLSLQKEIEALESAEYHKSAEVLSKSTRLVDLMKKTESVGRKKKLASGAEAYIGKTAQDNLQILRAAKAWDFWLHLRDYPGAHAVIHREKNQSISDSEIQQVARWVAEESLSKKTLALGQKLNVILVECRFVKPIKGDKHGRVHFHGERNLVISYEK